MRGGRFRFIGFVNVGVIGEKCGGRLFRIIGISLVGIIGEMIFVFIEAVILLWIVALLMKSLLRLFLA
jgi:hypothetical protein